MRGFSMSREFWIGEKDQKIEKEGINAVVYYSTEKGYPVAKGFSGKKNKPDFNYRFRSEQQMNEHIENFFKSIQSYQNRKTEKRNERKNFKTSLKKDDIVYGTWGYEQTNVNFYQVIEVLPTGKTVKIREIAGMNCENTGYMTGKSKAAKDNFIGPVMTKRVSPGDYVTINDCISASKWDGHAVSYSSYY